MSCIRQRALAACLRAILPIGTAATPCAGLAAPAPASPAAPAEVHFNAALFGVGDDSSVDISRFARGNVVLPGSYLVDINVNDRWIRRGEVRFVEATPGSGASACFSWEDVIGLGIKSPPVAGNLDDTFGTSCARLDVIAPGSTMAFNTADQVLDISVPQLYMKAGGRDAVDPAQWQPGITAGIANYNFSASRRRGTFGGTDAYLGLDMGLNLGAWRLRQRGNANWSSLGGGNYQVADRYLERDFPSWRARVTVGDSFTSGSVLDSVRIRGVRLATDNAMLPLYQQGYAPAARGVASGNATVTVRQNGYVLYETTVAPGPFQIDDLFPTGYGGDLEVTVTTLDGDRRIYRVPYAAVPQLVRPGVTQYDLIAGELRQLGVGGDAPWAMQGTLQRGVSNLVTANYGATVSQGYLQGKAGVALNTAIGAFAMDLAHARTRIPGDGSIAGTSYGLTYARNLGATGTAINLGAYRYASTGYAELADAASLREAARNGLSQRASLPRHRVIMSATQALGMGNVMVSGTSTDYGRNGPGRQLSYNAAYSFNWRSVGISLSAERSRITPGARDPSAADQADDVFFGRDRRRATVVEQRAMLNLTIPLGTDARAPNLFANIAGHSRGTESTATMSGSFDQARTLNYNVGGSHTHVDGRSSSQANFNLGYQPSYALLRAGFSQGGGNQQLSVGASGGVVAHGHGMAFGQQFGEAIALVHAPGAEGASVGGAVGVRVGKAGYAVVPNLRAYQQNGIELDPAGAVREVSFENSLQYAIPTRGAVVPLVYKTDTRRTHVIRARRADGRPLPFAASVVDEHGQQVGVVGQGSKMFLRGAEAHGSWIVEWAEGADGSCKVQFDPGNNLAAGVTSPYQGEFICR
jgi:outer membrane usher protein